MLHMLVSHEILNSNDVLFWAALFEIIQDDDHLWMFHHQLNNQISQSSKILTKLTEIPLHQNLSQLDAQVTAEHTLAQQSKIFWKK